MAKCIIEKCLILLRIENGDIKLIPVMVALSYNSKGIEMARYLYSETHLEDLMPKKSFNGATLITRVMYAKAFGTNLNIVGYKFIVISIVRFLCYNSISNI